jgi:hypothetical protein
MRQVSLAVLLALGFSLSVAALPPDAVDAGRQKSSAHAEFDISTYIDINQLLMFTTNVGSFAYDNWSMLGKADGLYYPRGTNKTVVYAAGLWLGAKVNGNLRVSLAEYSHTYAPGPMIFGGSQPDDPSFKVYKIIKELKTSGFYDGPRPAADPAEQELWDDYHNWPADQGAPLDWYGDPEFIGDQTLWCVFNDYDPYVRTNSSATTEGLGVEVQLTTFAFMPFEPDDPLGKSIIMRYLIINRTGDTINDMYAAIWGDPDVGAAGDDFVGCVPDMDLGYAYNATNDDAVYGLNPPAVGFDILQGPIVPSPGDTALFIGQNRADFRNLPMTAFAKYINNTDPDNPQESYWYMQGLDANNSGAPIIDPTTSLPTTFMYPGDPTTGTGWIDENPSDRRMMCNSGPFTMAPGDSQEVYLAVLVDQGSDRLESVTELIIMSHAIQSLFDQGFFRCDCSGIADLDDNGVHSTTLDMVYMINYMFKGLEIIPPNTPNCPVENRADYNCDGRINLVDLVMMINWAYRYPAPGPCDPCTM